MKLLLTTKLWQYTYKRDKGFTLIELLVVSIMISILAAVALPNLLNQIGKGRETEATVFLGTLNRAQETYHFEHSTFASTPAELAVTLDAEYYNYSILSSNNAIAIHKADGLNNIDNRTRDFLGVAGYNTGVYTQRICRANSISLDLTIADISSSGSTVQCNAGTTEAIR